MANLNSAFQSNPALELKIREMIRGLYGKDFVHRIVVRYDGESYQLRLHVHDNIWCPIVISMLTDDEDKFIEYICKELSSRELIRSSFIEVNLGSPEKAADTCCERKRWIEPGGCVCQTNTSTSSQQVLGAVNLPCSSIEASTLILTSCNNELELELES